MSLIYLFADIKNRWSPDFKSFFLTTIPISLYVVGLFYTNDYYQAMKVFETGLPLFIFPFLYFIIFHIIGYRKKVVYRNLQNAFPDKDKDEIDKIARKFYKHFCDVIFETLKELHMSEAEMTKRVRYNNSELINKYVD